MVVCFAACRTRRQFLFLKIIWQEKQLARGEVRATGHDLPSWSESYIRGRNISQLLALPLHCK